MPYLYDYMVDHVVLYFYLGVDTSDLKKNPMVD